ncbi:Hypothetical predicted protein [Pelobates cultripes]|uniref:Uncharacterized protein n=1 Tax=Pelobates cultripes TaxID=61616 RepID=A0AAD1TP24_PELCU|nr:Hypothetical predicted protein [Pelobates cultripes]
MGSETPRLLGEKRGSDAHNVKKANALRLSHTLQKLYPNRRSSQRLTMNRERRSDVTRPQEDSSGHLSVVDLHRDIQSVGEKIDRLETKVDELCKVHNKDVDILAAM